MIEGRPDWCISRQRTWVCQSHSLYIKIPMLCIPRTPELIEEVAQLIEQEGLMVGITVMRAILLAQMLNSIMPYAIP